MPRTSQYNNRDVGDDIYEQFTLRKTFELTDNVAGVKGSFYTMTAYGRLTPITCAASIVDLSNGVFQAAANRGAVDVTLTAGVPDKPLPTVQAHMKGGWILAKAIAGMVPGMLVVPQNDTASTVVAGTVKPAVASTDVRNVMGTLYEIVTKGTNDGFKRVTEADDLVVIQLGVI